MGKKEVIIASDILLRVTLPLFIWQNPVLVTVLSGLADLCDGLALNTIARVKRSFYQKLDKVLDFYFHTIALIYLWGKPFFVVFLVFFLLRLLGVVFLMIAGSEKILIFFPNVIEFLFFLYIFTLVKPQYSWFLEGRNLYLSVGAIAVMKTIQEHLMHRKYVCLRKKILELLGFRRLAKIVTPPSPSRVSHGKI